MCKMSRCIFITTVVAVVSIACVLRAEQVSRTVDSAYPGTAQGVLSYAEMAELPDGLLLESGAIRVSKEQLQEFIADSWLAEQFNDFPFFALEEHAGALILVALARQDNEGTEAEPVNGDALVGGYLERKVKVPDVTDTEVEAYYEKIKDRIGYPLEEVREPVRWQIQREKRQVAIDAYVRAIGKDRRIRVSAPWVREQAKLARQNPIDQARAAGKPVLTVFSSANCCGPAQTMPLMDDLYDRHGDRIAILHLDVQMHQILAARFGVRNAPTFILYAKDGKELFRDSGSTESPELVTRIDQMLKD